jgi:hypothetical protein
VIGARAKGMNVLCRYQPGFDEPGLILYIRPAERTLSCELCLLTQMVSARRQGLRVPSVYPV